MYEDTKTVRGKSRDCNIPWKVKLHEVHYTKYSYKIKCQIQLFFEYIIWSLLFKNNQSWINVSGRSTTNRLKGWTNRLGGMDLINEEHILHMYFFHNHKSNNNYYVLYYNEIFSRNNEIINRNYDLFSRNNTIFSCNNKINKS